jgi:hypothetical protein
MDVIQYKVDPPMHFPEQNSLRSCWGPRQRTESAHVGAPANVQKRPCWRPRQRAV